MFDQIQYRRVLKKREKKIINAPSRVDYKSRSERIIESLDELPSIVLFTAGKFDSPDVARRRRCLSVTRDKCQRISSDFAQ